MNSSKSLKFKIEGMTCSACSQIIEQETTKLPGITSAAVNFATESAEFSINDQFDDETFQALLKKLGYRAIDPFKHAEKNEDKFFDEHFLQTLVCLVLAGITMIFAMVFPSMTGSSWIQAALTTIIIFIYGRSYVFAVWAFIISLKSNMNTLIGLGTLSAYFYSFYLLSASAHAHPYFEGAAFIIAFSRLGHFLDQKAKTKARSSLGSLYKMQIKFASKVNSLGKEENTAVVELKVGDVIRLRPGEKFPLDGEIIEGETHADESMLTGESQAVTKTAGSKVFAGSLNMEGSVLVKISAGIHETALSKIVSFVEEAQLKKADIQLYADKVVKYFVPVIILMATLTFTTWFIFSRDLGFALNHMVAVLVIACPCALGLAVPMAIMISTGEAAKSGLLVSGGHVIEKGAHINTVVFDKTGTLTEGAPELTSIVLFNEKKYTDKSQLLQLAASASQYSSHPLSQCLYHYAVKQNLSLKDPDKFQSLTGLGLVAQLNAHDIILGNISLLQDKQVPHHIPEEFYETHLGSYIFMAIDNELAAAFVITDPLKKEASSLVKNLKQQNIDVWMLTGDHERIAHHIGKELGIDPLHIRAGAKPGDKALFIEELQSRKLKVAMIGDGINDAPALSKADLSIAMGNGADVAIETAEVSILGGKILHINDFFLRSRKTMTIIKENLILSSLYNALCIPLAAGAFYPWFKMSLTPMWASLAMALSSLSVIMNSLRLKKRPT